MRNCFGRNKILLDFTSQCEIWHVFWPNLESTTVTSGLSLAKSCSTPDNFACRAFPVRLFCPHRHFTQMGLNNLKNKSSFGNKIYGWLQNTSSLSLAALPSRKFCKINVQNFIILCIRRKLKINAKCFRCSKELHS